MFIPDHHVEQWREDGYTVAPLLSRSEVDQIRSRLHDAFPSARERLAQGLRYPNLRRHEHVVEGPFLLPELNQVAVHADLISFVERALDTHSVLLAQSLLWVKYGTGRFSQPIHRDYADCSLLPPSDLSHQRQLCMILYYTDVEEGCGPTHVVRRAEAAQIPLAPPMPVPEVAAAVATAQRAITVPAGSVLIFDTDVLHRASDFTDGETMRISHHMNWRPAACDWMGWAAWAHLRNNVNMQAWLSASTPRQRAVLGFPLPGDPYWTERTIEATACLYPDMDMAAYREACGASREGQVASLR
jgi:Phytanoyl-CoA dioxygenase (PhyH)